MKSSSNLNRSNGLGSRTIRVANQDEIITGDFPYSQSRHTNSGTRGLGPLGRKVYVETALDRELTPTIFAGEFGLVLITGNAGDGKTAYLLKLEGQARSRGARFDVSVPNGCRFTLNGRTYLSNYDGSQDEGERQSDDVLRDFFAPYGGTDPDTWPQGEIRLIAINEGRLVDFLAAEHSKFPLLTEIVQRGLGSGASENRVAVVNLNLRSVVADVPTAEGSVLERLLRRMTHEKFWKPCQNCDLKDRCCAHHNARTIQDETAGPKVIERLKTLYTLTHLRGRLHITLRDLGSALAYMLVGTRNCSEIHTLYQTGDREQIIQGFFFNSWMAGVEPNADRLLSLLKDVDVGQATDPRLDRALDFVSPGEDRNLFSFDNRGNYDREILRRKFDDLPRDFSGLAGSSRTEAHQHYVALLRRRSFFERRDSGWKSMLPYRSADRMLSIVSGQELPGELFREVLDGINH